MARPNGPVAAADCKHSASAANKHAGSLKPVMLVLKDAAIIAIAAGSGDVDLAAGSSLPLYYSISLCAGLCLVAWPKEAGHGSAAPPGGRGEAASGARLLLQASNRSGRGDSAVGFGSLPLSMLAPLPLLCCAMAATLCTRWWPHVASRHALCAIMYACPFRRRPERVRHCSGWSGWPDCLNPPSPHIMTVQTPSPPT